jgi:hypothetical protein
MNHQSLFSRAIALVAGIVLLAASAFASADPPSQVIRLGYTTGAVSFSPAGEDDWVRATLNRPMTIGDRLWVDSGARAELQIGGSMLRLNGPSGITVLNLEDNLAQLQLTQGAMNVRVRHLDPDQVIEIDTPNLAFTLRQPGSYRIVVDTDGNTTDVIVRNGRAEVYGDGASYVMDSRQSYRFYDTGLQDYEQFASPRLDDFDRWASDRDRRYDTSISARYVSPDVIGYQDLDTYGTWRPDPTYGNVWYPTRVSAEWAPYRDGHWAWVDPWGWTWVDDAPWGFAVSHYGRWAYVGGRWGWVPGPVRTRAYYAPALVAFVGGNNFSLSISTGNVGAVGWFPLGPQEVYRPWYSASRRYFEQVNVSNTVVNTTVVNNYYNNTNVTQVNYVNRQVPGAVVAVPTTAFVQAQPVQRAAVRVTPQMVASAPVAPVAPVAPTERSVRGSAAQAQTGTPPARVFQREVVARRAPAPAPANFAAQQQELQKQPGRPLDEAARKEVRAAPATPAPQVKVVAQPQATPPTATPPPASQTAREGRGRGRPGTPAEGAQPPATAEKGAPAQVAQPGASTQPAERGKGQDRAKGKDAERGQPTEAAPGTLATPAPQPRAGSPAQTRIQQQQQEQAPQAQQQQSPRAERQARQAEREAEQQKAREAQAAQQQQQQQARQAEQQQRQAEQQKAREAQAAQQQQARQAQQQQARQAQAEQQARQQQAREAQAAQQQQARQAQQQQARQAQAEQQARQQQAREAQAAQQQQARQAQQQQAPQAHAEQQQAQQQRQPPRQGQEARGRGKDKDDDQKREEEKGRQRG